MEIGTGPTTAEGWLVLLAPYGVKHIQVGGCMKNGRLRRFRRKAHAHTGLSDPQRGVICVLSAKRLSEPLLLFHEAAHIYRRSWTEKQCDGWAYYMACAYPGLIKIRQIRLTGGKASG